MTPAAEERRRYARVGLGLVLVAVAAPYRYYAQIPVVASVSVLDLALLIGAVIMLARASQGPIDIGDRTVFGLLCVPAAMSLLSLVWTQDINATVRETLTYAEALVAYAFAVQQTQGVPAQRIVTWLRRLAYLLLVPAALMLLHLPGFAPQEPGLNPRSGDYISYFTRLSHPFIGRSNNLATVLAMLVVVLFYWGVTRRDRATSIAAMITIVAIMLTVSRGVIIALMIVGLLYGARQGQVALRAIRRHRVLERLIVAVAVIGFAAFLFYQLNPDTHDFIAQRLSTANLALREGRFSNGLTKLWDRPWLGYGAGVDPDNDPSIAGGVHDTYLQQLLAYGVVLGLVVILSMVELFRQFLRPGASTLRQMVGLTVLAQLIIFVSEASFEGAVLRVIFYFLLGMLVGLLRAQEASRPAGESQATVVMARG